MLEGTSGINLILYEIRDRKKGVKKKEVTE